MTWPGAFKSLEEALDAAASDDIIWVAEGDYVPTLETDPGEPRSRTFLFTDDKALKLYGGFLGNDHPQGGETLLWGPCPCPDGTPSPDECADRDLGANCECRDTLTDLIENGTPAESENARCWLDHYIECHDAQGCNAQPDCPDDDPCGKH